MRYRIATVEDAEMLGEMNLQLVQDQKHRYADKPVEWFVARMREQLLRAPYTAVVFEDDGDGVVAYALYRDDGDDGVYLRQLFVVRGRRREGIGTAAMQRLLEEVWPAGTRITLEVLCGNAAAWGLYRKLGFREYCVTLER